MINEKPMKKCASRESEATEKLKFQLVNKKGV